MDRQCTGGRIESKQKLTAEVKKWTKDRNKKNAKSNGGLRNKMPIRNYQDIMFHNQIVNTLVSPACNVPSKGCVLQQYL
jgi:hypothetical protein